MKHWHTELMEHAGVLSVHNITAEGWARPLPQPAAPPLLPHLRQMLPLAPQQAVQPLPLLGLLGPLPPHWRLLLLPLPPHWLLLLLPLTQTPVPRCLTGPQLLQQG